MSEEESENEEEEEEVEEVEQKEEKKVDGPNLNEFSRFQQYGNYYKPGPFAYTNSFNSYQNSYNPYANNLSYSNPQRYNNYNYQPYQQVNQIGNEVSNLRNFASRVVWDEPVYVPKYNRYRFNRIDDFQEGNWEKKYKKTKIMQQMLAQQRLEDEQRKRFELGYKLAQDEGRNPDIGGDWRERMQREEYRKYQEQHKQEIDLTEYQEFLEFQKFRQGISQSKQPQQNKQNKVIQSVIKPPQQQLKVVDNQDIIQEDQPQYFPTFQRASQQSIFLSNPISGERQQQPKSVQDLYKRKQQNDQSTRFQRNDPQLQKQQKDLIDNAINQLKQ